MMRVHRRAQVVRQLVQWKVARVVDKFDGMLQQATLSPPLAVLQAHTHAPDLPNKTNKLGFIARMSSRQQC
jgi:hypothetical protein